MEKIGYNTTGIRYGTSTVPKVTIFSSKFNVRYGTRNRTLPALDSIREIKKMFIFTSRSILRGIGTDRYHTVRYGTIQKQMKTINTLVMSFKTLFDTNLSTYGRTDVGQLRQLAIVFSDMSGYVDYDVSDATVRGTW